MWAADRCRRRKQGSRRAGQHGQAALELLAALPLLVAVGLLAWQLVAVLGAAQEATGRARTGVLRASGDGSTLTIERAVRVPSFLPGTGALTVTARSAVRAP